MAFKKAKRTQSKLRLAIQGASGSGKTYGALLLAKGLNAGKIAVIDTERGSASLYAGMPGMPDFDVMDLTEFNPEAYIAGIKEAEQAGYGVIVIDSITHEWNGAGGCLELVENIGRAKYRGNSWAAWNDVTPRHRAFIDKILTSPCHIIATMRSKQDTIQTENDKGRKVVQKIGLKAEQREGVDYEFTTVFDITQEHICTVSKDRTNLFRDPFTISEETGKQIAAWLNSADTEQDKPAPEKPKATAKAAKKQEVTPADIADDDAIGERELLAEFKARIVESESEPELKELGQEIKVTPISDAARKELQTVYKNKLKELRNI